MSFAQLVRRGQLVWTYLNDRLLNISTMDVDTPDPWRCPRTVRCLHPDNRGYQAPDYYYVRKVLKILNPQESDVVYDIGSGMGRILCVFGRKRVRKCVGIEVLPELCDISKTNAARVRGKQCLIEVRCEDAATADMSDGTVYFMFNPFGPETLSDVLNNLGSSLERNPRTLQIVYYNAYHRQVLDGRPWLKPHYAFTTWNGLRAQFYKSV